METISCNNAGTTPYECHNTGARSTNRSLRLLMSNKAFSLVSGSCKLATRCSIFNACWLFDEALLVFEVVLVVCCCVCAACAAAIIIARTNRLPIDWKRFSLSARNAFRIYVSNKYRSYASGIFLETQKAVSHDSFTPKEVIRVFVVVVLFRRCCCCCCCCRGKLFSSLFH